MVDYTKDQLKEINRELKEKIKELKGVEKQITATAEDLKLLSIGVDKDIDGKFLLVYIKYDVSKNAAIIDKVEKLDTFDFAIASFKARELLVEKILRKARGDKYAE